MAKEPNYPYIKISIFVVSRGCTVTKYSNYKTVQKIAWEHFTSFAEKKKQEQKSKFKDNCARSNGTERQSAFVINL